MEKYPGRDGGKQCAEAFGVSPQQWSPWESGKRRPDELRLEEIATFFGKVVEWFRRDNREAEPDAAPGADSFPAGLSPAGAPSIPDAPELPRAGKASAILLDILHASAALQQQDIQFHMKILQAMSALENNAALRMTKEE